MSRFSILLNSIICALVSTIIIQAQPVKKNILRPSSPNLEQIVGDEVSFTIAARDKNGNVIRGWNTSGSDITLIVSNSTANTDNEPLTTTVIRDKNRNPLQQQGANTFILPKTLFIEGETQIIFMTTKSDTGIYITASPAIAGIINVGARMNYKPDAVQNFLVEIVPAKQPNIVNVMRRYELRISPRDQFNNPNTTENVFARLTARYPGEFTSDGTGASGLFEGEIMMQGSTNYLLMSTTTRTDQEIICYRSADDKVRGITGLYTIADHAPMSFHLISPPDQAEIRLQKSSDIEKIKWTQSIDPYSNIDILGQKYSDNVTYIWNVTTSIRSTTISLNSNNVGIDTILTFLHTQLYNLARNISGNIYFPPVHLIWWVEATDGLFTTRSIEEWRLTITTNWGTDVKNQNYSETISLNQNYPNPFGAATPSAHSLTSISFALPYREFVQLKIYNLLGEEVETLVNETCESGSHSRFFDAHNIPSGMYLYRLTAGSQSLTRMMTLMK